MVETYIQWILRYRWWVILGSLIWIGVLAVGVDRVQVADNFKALLGEENPELVAFEEFEANYSASNSALIAVESTTGDVFTVETLQAIELLTELVWETPYSSRVDSLTNATASRSLDGDLYVEKLVEDASILTEEDTLAIKDIAMNDRDLVGRLVARDARVAAVTVNFVVPDEELNAITSIYQALTDIKEQFEADYPDLRLYITGVVVYNATIQQSMTDGVTILFPIAFVLMLVVIITVLRSLLGTVSIVLVFMSAIIATVGIAGWLGTVFTPMMSAMPVTIIVLAVAHSIHILSPITSGLRTNNDRNAVIVESIKSHAWPIMLTSVTTIIGFLSLNSSDSPPIKDLGNYVALGTFLIFCLSMTLLPALLSVLPLKANKKGRDFASLFTPLANFVINYRTALIFVMLGIAIVAAWGIQYNVIYNNWTKQFDDSYQFQRDTVFILENLTGLNELEFSLDSGEESGITNLDYLQQVDEFSNWLREQEHVEHVRSFADIMKRLNQNMNNDSEEHYRLPETKELATQYLLLYEFSIPFGRDLNDRIDVGKQSSRLTATIADLPDFELRRIAIAAQAWLRENAPELEVDPTGIAVVFSYLTDRNLKRILLGTGIGMALISFILIFCFRSIKYGLISLIPNFVPPILGFGIWGYLFGVMSLECAITIIIAFGILVDDTIHFLTKYRDARLRGESSIEAVRYAIQTVGKALWTTTIVVVAGFMVFATSEFMGIYVLGLMTSLLVFLGILIDFFLLPPILMWIDRDSKPGETALDSGTSAVGTSSSS